MRKQSLAVLCLTLALAGCGWIEEQRKIERRRQAETELVANVESGRVSAVRERLEKDRTLANSIRMVPGRRRSYPTESALTLAAKQARRDMIEVLFEFGADPNKADGTGAVPLVAALRADKDRRAVVALLLEKGADPLKADSGGATALHHASESGARESAAVLELILAKVSGTGGPNARGLTPLHLAAGAASAPAIRLLIAKGADPNVQTTAPRKDAAFSDDVAGATPLAIVARDRQIAAAATLCALGANPDLADATGASARQVAVRVTAAEAARSNPTNVDLVRHRNMAAFLAKGAGCDALVARKNRRETIAEAEVLRIANESECGAGWGWACGQAGWAFYKGEGAPEDAARALALFRNGCETALTKDEWCCGMTGVLYVDGTGVPSDPTEGARWLSKGCETADPKRADEQACNRLGLLVAEGRGVPKDVGRARTFFKRACDLKYDRACANLAKYP
jgi:hypothetical protein